MIVGVDGWNCRGGGVLTHLPNLMRHADPERVGISKMIVWGNSELIERLPERPWLVKRRSRWLETALPVRVLWHELLFPRELRTSGCDVVWCPTGLLPRRWVAPTVAMLRNSIPFDAHVLSQYPWPRRFRFKLVGRSLVRSLRHADGVLFVSEFGRSLFRGQLGGVPQQVVYHGIEERFHGDPRPQRPLSAYTAEDPFRFLYVSHVHPYKNHAVLIRAVGRMRRAGLPVALECVGFAYSMPALEEMRTAMAELDPRGSFLRYSGDVPFDEVHKVYRRADAFAFPSICENLPNILIEAMSAGLPIASSNLGPMPELLRDGGLYFDPHSVGDVARALAELAESPELRRTLAHRARVLVGELSWSRCAGETLAFLTATAVRHGTVPKEGERGRSGEPAASSARRTNKVA